MKKVRVLICTGVFIGCLLGLSDISNGNSFLENDYWDSGKAEFQVYTASVKKYGMDRNATVKVILVKEPFDPIGLVKTRNEDESVSVIKLNFIRQIPVGIYDYFQMASIFFERRTGRILKYTMSSQDGCGNTFMEYLLREGKHLLHYHSYFDDEGDSETVLEAGEFTFYDALPFVLRFRLTQAGEYRLNIMDSLISNKTVPLTIREGLVKNRTEEAVKVGERTYPRVFIAEVLRGEEKDLFVFEPDYPYRLLEWRQADGDEIMLNQSHSLYYWLYTRPNDRSLGIVQDGI
jgi:hypothetical protein